jgi:hypothetical protein
VDGINAMSAKPATHAPAHAAAVSRLPGLTWWVLGLAVLVFRGDWPKDAELLVLRHENAVLRRYAGRVRYDPADRVWFAALARLLPRKRWTGIFPVTPTTLLGPSVQAQQKDAGHERDVDAACYSPPEGS